MHESCDMKNQNWKKYAYEFLSIFFAVILAFSLNRWNENRKEYRAGSKILTEIHSGLAKDLEDVELNVMGHKAGMRACQFWREVFAGGKPNLDTLQRNYFILTRDFTSIQNTSGYETLKSRGLELIRNDELRKDIVSLYEYDYKTLIKLEEQYEEAQFHKSYFEPLNKFMAPILQFNDYGIVVDLDLPAKLNEQDMKLLDSYLWKIHGNRYFVLQYYKEVAGKIKALRAAIGEELEL